MNLPRFPNPAHLRFDAPSLHLRAETGERFVCLRRLAAAGHKQGRLAAVPCGKALQRDLGAAAELEVSGVNPDGRVCRQVVLLAKFPSFVRSWFCEWGHRWRNHPQRALADALLTETLIRRPR